MKNKRLYIILAILLLAAVLAGFSYLFITTRSSGLYIKSEATKSDKGLVEGFPSELILGPREFKENYKLSYENGQEQYTTEFASNFKDVNEAYDAYTKIFKGAHYTIIGQSKDQEFANIYGRSNDGKVDVSVLINLKGKTVMVTLTYLKNK